MTEEEEYDRFVEFLDSIVPVKPIEPSIDTIRRSRDKTEAVEGRLLSEKIDKDIEHLKNIKRWKSDNDTLEMLREFSENTSS